MKRTLSTLLAATALIGLAGAAQAHSSIGVGINVGGPAYRPAPVYVAPPPPPYYAPPPAVYYGPGYYPRYSTGYRIHYWNRPGYRGRYGWR